MDSEAVQILRIIIPIIAPLITALIKKWLMPSIPKVALPLATAAVGGVAAAFVPEVSGTEGVILGLAGGGVREVVDQTRKTTRDLLNKDRIARAND